MSHGWMSTDCYQHNGLCCCSMLHPTRASNLVGRRNSYRYIWHTNAPPCSHIVYVQRAIADGVIKTKLRRASIPSKSNYLAVYVLLSGKMAKKPKKGSTFTVGKKTTTTTTKAMTRVSVGQILCMGGVVVAVYAHSLQQLWCLWAKLSIT